MANAEHLKILKEGVEVWNRWREKNKKVRPDLSGADLSKADLSGANLSGADLRSATLVHARLVDANLSLANLANADLRSADMEGVNLQKADLSGTKLSYAPPVGGMFSDAFRIRTNLRNADLRGANLTNADIQGALIDGALLINVNLNGTNMAETSGKAIFKKPADKLKNRIRTTEIKHPVRKVILEPGSGYKEVFQNAKTENTLQFDGIFPFPFRSNTWQDLLVYVYYKYALEKVLADFERRKQNLSGPLSGVSVESQQKIPPDSLLTIIPDIPSVVCEPPSFQFRMTGDYHCQPFRVMHKTTPVLEKLGRGRIKGSVRIYLETLVIGEIPVESEWEAPGYVAPVQPTMVNAFAAQPQSMAAASGDSFKRQSAQAFRKIFASFSESDKPIIERLEKAYKALGDDYWHQYQRLRAGQDKSKAIEEAIQDSDVFQLCWSTNAKTAENVEREWRIALSREVENFIRPIFWEKPMPEPPEELRHLYFDYYQVDT